jgi:predicted HD phosphohydrolase
MLISHDLLHRLPKTDLHVHLDGSLRPATQGGPLGPDEVAAFEATAGWHEAVTLRRWDDAGKRHDLDVAGIGAYRSLLAALVRPAT